MIFVSCGGSSSLYDSSGGVILRNATSQTLDRVGWGSVASEYYDVLPAQNITASEFLERKAHFGSTETSLKIGGTN